MPFTSLITASLHGASAMRAAFVNQPEGADGTSQSGQQAGSSLWTQGLRPLCRAKKTRLSPFLLHFPQKQWPGTAFWLGCLDIRNGWLEGQTAGFPLGGTGNAVGADSEQRHDSHFSYGSVHGARWMQKREVLAVIYEYIQPVSQQRQIDFYKSVSAETFCNLNLNQAKIIVHSRGCWNKLKLGIHQFIVAVPRNSVIDRCLLYNCNCYVFLSCLKY